MDRGSSFSSTAWSVLGTGISRSYHDSQGVQLVNAFDIEGLAYCWSQPGLTPYSFVLLGAFFTVDGENT